ncbi:hypothetical protein SKAU_G00124640 [Synaphobranchus kaupii]|uniref:Uncharacterized protein n=1 Tax=Synaphobranchus kaupii TaxID=118154 RepID=A0A9Q1J2S3_SYNKA|nr:hypothetical protein SKAU_G00124640 [Synaphobranchus kaupii]
MWHRVPVDVLSTLRNTEPSSSSKGLERKDWETSAAPFRSSHEGGTGRICSRDIVTFPREEGSRKGN